VTEWSLATGPCRTHDRDSYRDHWTYLERASGARMAARRPFEVARIMCAVDFAVKPLPHALLAVVCVHLAEAGSTLALLLPADHTRTPGT
jgi:hypothetical protein